ncbi:alginate lyase [Clostridium oceanicum]|uniref:Alginate lyase n=1 Tax=Clostridium oceanicum TaxID=1543 RepID=A0ABP3V422_9CLOT
MLYNFNPCFNNTEDDNMSDSPNYEMNRATPNMPNTSTPMPWWQQQPYVTPPMSTQTPMPSQTETPTQPPMMTIPPAPMPLQPEVPIQNDINYNQGFLKTQIGKKIKVEFLIGSNMLIDREGTLVGVGISYILIDEVDTNDLVMADIYSIKFVRIFD